MTESASWAAGLNLGETENGSHIKYIILHLVSVSNQGNTADKNMSDSKISAQGSVSSWCHSGYNHGRHINCTCLLVMESAVYVNCKTSKSLVRFKSKWGCCAHQVQVYFINPGMNLAWIEGNCGLYNRKITKLRNSKSTKTSSCNQSYTHKWVYDWLHIYIM